MKKYSILIIAAFLTSCVAAPVQIGQINMISNRNMGPGSNYELLQKFSGSGKRQLQQSNARSLNDAVDNVVRSVPGGEYLMNAKIYKVGSFFAAEGDVWGIPGQTEINGLKPDGIAYFKWGGKMEKVKVISFQPNDKVNIQRENGKVMVVKREWLVNPGKDQ